MQAFLSTTPLGTLLAGRYKIIEVLSADGFSNTYIAEDTHQTGCPKCIVKQLVGSEGEGRSPYPSPSPMRSSWRLFAREVQILNKLASCDRVVRLLASFKENKDFYCVQEFVLGQPLSEELLLVQRWGKPATVWQCLEILQEALQVLELVHQQGVIHSNLKPENLIRRAWDGKLVLIDFSGAKEIRPGQPPGQLPIAVPIGTFGYLSPEQLAGNPQPNSDLYALGLIGIQALTGLHPALLQIDSATGELSWQHHAPVPPDDAIASILNKMVRAHSKNRYQSATEVLQALQAYRPPQSPPPVTVSSIRIADNLEKENFNREGISAESLSSADFTSENLSSENFSSENFSSENFRAENLSQANAENKESDENKANEASETSEEILSCALENGDRLSLSLAPAPAGLPENEALEELEDALSSAEPGPKKAKSKNKNQKRSPLMMGAGAGMAMNAVTIVAALHSLFYFVPTDAGINALTQARNYYQSGQLQEAIGLVKSIGWDSSVYEEAQGEIERWQVEWDKAAAKFQELERAFQEDSWQNVLSHAAQLPPISYWQNKSEPMVQKAALEMAPAAREFLEKAYQQAGDKNFATAIGFLEKVPFGTPAYETARSQMALYREQLQARLEVEAHRLLQQAYGRAVAKDFTGALKLLQEIPEGTSTYEKVQAKISEYSKKQGIKANRSLQRAYDLATVGDYNGAIALLRKIPAGTAAYPTGQAKIDEYGQRLYRASQSRRARRTRQTRRKRRTRRAARSRRVSSAMSSPSLNPGDSLQEINPSGLS